MVNLVHPVVHQSVVFRQCNMGVNIDLQLNQALRTTLNFSGIVDIQVSH